MQLLLICIDCMYENHGTLETLRRNTYSHTRGWLEKTFKNFKLNKPKVNSCMVSITKVKQNIKIHSFQTQERERERDRKLLVKVWTFQQVGFVGLSRSSMNDCI